MHSRDPLRGPRALVTHVTSYVARRPFALGYGLDALSRPAAVALAPVVAGWSVARAASGAIDAFRIGMQAFRAPLLREDARLLAPLETLVPVCTLVSDAHVTTAGRVAVLGMPSSTLGDKAQTGILDGILRYAVPGLRADGRWGVAIVAVGALRG